jgi:hypothetical protein
LLGGLNIPLLYEDIKFTRRLADTQDITVNPTTPISVSKNTWIIIGSAAAGILIIAAAASTHKGGT